MWRIWKSGRATLAELETHWSMVDVWTANLILDLEDDADAEAENAIPDPKGR